MAIYLLDIEINITINRTTIGNFRNYKTFKNNNCIKRINKQRIDNLLEN